MFRKNNFLFIMIILLAAGIFGTLWFYNTYIVPNARMSSTYMEVYQDLDANEIKTISIDTINNKVNVVVTNDQKIKISYFQRTDSANSFVVNKNDVSLKIIERTETPSNSFISSTRRVDTITIYLPAGSEVSLTNKTYEGQLTIDGVSLNRITASSINGAITIRNCRAGSIDLNTNSGEVNVSDNEFSNAVIQGVTGKVTMKITDSLALYNLNIRTENGFLTVNNERVREVVDEQETVVNYMEVEREGVERSIKLTSFRGNISLVSNEEAVSNNEEATNAESEGVQE